MPGKMPSPSGRMADIAKALPRAITAITLTDEITALRASIARIERRIAKAKGPQLAKLLDLKMRQEAKGYELVTLMAEGKVYRPAKRATRGNVDQRVTMVDDVTKRAELHAKAKPMIIRKGD